MDYKVVLVSAVTLIYLVGLLLCYIDRADVVFYIIVAIPIAGSLGLFVYSAYSHCRDRVTTNQEDLIL